MAHLVHDNIVRHAGIDEPPPRRRHRCVEFRLEITEHDFTPHPVVPGVRIFPTERSQGQPRTTVFNCIIDRPRYVAPQCEPERVIRHHGDGVDHLLVKFGP